MTRIVLLLSALFAVAFTCEDGVDNVIKVHDTTKGKGKVQFEGVEIWTYDKDKKPSCSGDGPNFMLPGHFKVAKGKVHVTEAIKENPSSPLKLALTVEKQSWIIGVVCENGKSKNQFVPDEICKFDFCKLAGDKICGMMGTKTPVPIDISLLTSQDLIDIGPMPIPQLGGDWQIAANLVDGKKVIGGIRLGKKGQWLTVETEESEGGFNYETSEPVPAPHEEL